MFGESEEEKKKKELEKAKEESKKMEEAGTGKDDKKGGSLAGLANFAPGETGKEDPGKPPGDKPSEANEEEPVKPPEEEKEEPPAEENAGESEEPAPKPAPKKKDDDPAVAKLRKQLEQQKASIEEAEKDREEADRKRDEMAGLVEELSGEIKETRAAPAGQAAVAPQPAAPDIEPKLRELEDRTASQIKELKDAMEAASLKKEDGKKGEEEVAETMKKMFDKRLKELSEKLDEKKEAPPKQEAAPAGEVSGGLMAMGGGVEFQKEIDKIKKGLKDMATLFDAFKEEAENRFMSIDKEMEAVDTVPDLEDKIKHLEGKLGTENVQKLKTLISSADDLQGEVIPVIVRRRVDERIDPLSKRLKDVEDALKKADEARQSVRTDIDLANKDIKSLFKFDERIEKLDEGLTGTKKLLAELRTLVRDLDKEQKKSTEDRMKEILPRMIEAESSSIRKEFTGRFAFIDDKMQSVENMVAESHKEISELAVLKGQFDKLEDEMQDLNDGLEKITGRLADLKSRDMDLEDMIKALQTPKEIITELDNKTKDIVDIRNFFVRRSDGLEQRINDLDERAVPTKKLNDRVGAIANDVKALGDSFKGLEQRISSEKKEFHALIKQHAAEKSKLEETIKAQKARVAMLLHELK